MHHGTGQNGPDECVHNYTRGGRQQPKVEYIHKVETLLVTEGSGSSFRERNTC